MKATASELLRQLPGKVTDEWPMGERFIRGEKLKPTALRNLAPKEEIYL